MLQIALSNEFLERYGAQIRQVAPSQIELVVVDGNPADRAWTDAEILFKSEFATEISEAASPLSVIADMPRLRWVHSIYAGLDDLASPDLAARNIIVTNSAGVYAPMMAEYIIAMLVVLYRDLMTYMLAQTRHVWQPLHPLALPTQELYGKQLGIIGYGSVGRYLAPVARAFGMKVWGMRRTPTLPANEPLDRMLTPNELDELLQESDIVVISASLNKSTRQWLGARELGLMKRGAVLVNVARGAIVDESALVDALRAGHLLGAILDATTIEPLPSDHPLWDAPNVLITPHISGELPVGRQRSVDLFCENLRLYLAGQLDAMGNRVNLSAHL